jgi:FAD/FMN-containing dehydrogenase/Fe-S oxidoreductase
LRPTVFGLEPSASEKLSAPAPADVALGSALFGNLFPGAGFALAHVLHFFPEGQTVSDRSGASFPGAEAIARDLRRKLEGEVRFDDGSRALYSTDASNYRQVPIGVVLPRSVDDILATVEVCREHDAPILARGGGTSLAGQCCNAAVVIDTSKYLHRVLEIDGERRRARVEPGALLDDLRSRAEERHLTFGPDPATHDRCTLGGMIGNNSCGPHSVMAGKTDENVEELEVLTYDGERFRVGATNDAELSRILAAGGRRGEIFASLRALADRHGALIRERFPQIPRRVSGYNLPWLLPENGFHVARALVGSESTCALVLEATLRLVESPRARVLLVLGYGDVFAAAVDVPSVLEHGPIALEGMDRDLVEDMLRKRLHQREVALLPPGGGWLIAEFGGATAAEARSRARALMESLARRSCPPTATLVENPAEAKKIWLVRESALGATAVVPGQPPTWEGWEDSAVSPERLGDYLRDLRKLLRAHHLKGDLYGHFGQGCVHTRIDFELRTRRGIDGYRAFVQEAADLVTRYGGSLSGEHGDGQSRGELLPLMFGSEMLEVFREFKTIWDPRARMNPGKLIDAYPLDENLRLGTDYRPAPLETRFSFHEDRGSFAEASLRCVGAGLCRRMDGGIMCPSYMVTREEKHSTRGRARLLFEMTTGDVLRGRFREEAVKEALDLCLSCKGCKTECPVNVDMAAYKAEFLSHYYEGRLRPRAAYSMGLVHWWARCASLVPRLANFALETSLFDRLARRAAGIAPARPLPRIARSPFRRGFRSDAAESTGGPKVVLWIDTFNNYFRPSVLEAGAASLRRAGFRVVAADGALCCGRPLYDWGMLGLARKLLRKTLTALAKEIESGTPVVGLEPSCVSVFRDELPNLFPQDENARRLSSQTLTLGELFLRYPEAPLPEVRARALVQEHCHQRSVLNRDSEAEVMRRMGVDFQVPEPGCCGMAGAFGFEEDKYEISRAIGERNLLPAVRAADLDTWIVADGFSCREQIEHFGNRKASHLAELIHRGGAREA